MNRIVLTSLAIVYFFNGTNAQNSEVIQELKKTEIKASMIKALEWQEAHPIIASAPTDWTNGAYYTGVVRAHKTTQDMIYMAILYSPACCGASQTISPVTSSMVMLLLTPGII